MIQNGGPVRVPGSGSGDKVPMMLPSGSFVMNREASRFQNGGMVPTSWNQVRMYMDLVSGECST